MGLRRNTSTLDRPFTRNEVVLATEDLPGIPARSAGKVKMVAGFSWKRYWVFFDNGIQMGSLDSDQLVETPRLGELPGRQGRTRGSRSRSGSGSGSRPGSRSGGRSDGHRQRRR